MRKKKKRNNRVRTFPGDRKPAKSVSKDKMFYETKLSKWQGKMRWLVIERPTGSILTAYWQKLAEFLVNATIVCVRE